MVRADQLGAVEDRILRAWRELRRGPGVRRLRQLVLADAGGQLLDVPQVDALRAIVGGGGILMGDLARMFGIDPSTATRAIDQLERRGLVERERLSDNAKYIKVCATRRGKAMCSRIIANEARYIDAMLEAFDDGERKQLAELMERLAQALNRVVSQQGAPGSDKESSARGDCANR